MKSWIDSRWFTRFLEILPGAFVWSILIFPFIFATILPEIVAYFILTFSCYWFAKAINMMRNLLRGFPRLWRNMRIDWLERCKLASNNFEGLLEIVEKEYRQGKKRRALYDLREVKNLLGHEDLIKDWRQVYHLVLIANYTEGLDILEPTFDGLLDSNYPNAKLIVVLAGEGRQKAEFEKRQKVIEKKYGKKFDALLFYIHDFEKGEVLGKGSNIYSAAHKMMKFINSERKDILPENILVTTLDADHIVHREYFARLTYKYVIDPNRKYKTYQPVPLLFNNIWDAPAPNRVMAMSNSFFQIIEAVRPFRLRTFAAHAQSLETLLVTDFWSNKTIVEDGHQYWRTYFAYNGECEMVALFIPVYQDCVLAENLHLTIKNQYMQMRRWAWGISDLPFIIKNFLKHPEIPLGEKILQTFRHFAGHFSWSTASFLLAFAWIPLLFNESFQDSVLSHNLTYYTSIILNLALINLFANVWVFFLLLPKRPQHIKGTKYIGMFIQWILVPFVAIFLSAVPALESQTRLMLGKYLNVFWSTPKVRKSRVQSETKQ